MRGKAVVTALSVLCLLFLFLWAIFFSVQHFFFGVAFDDFPALLSGSEVPYVVVGSALVSVLGGYIAYLLFLSGHYATMLAREMTHDLAIDREQFRRLYDNSPVPYITLSPNGAIENANKAALRLFGVLYAELMAKDFFTFFFEEDKDKAQGLKARFRHDIPFECDEIRIVGKDGIPRTVMLSVFFMQKAASRAHVGVVTLVDITERKELDEAKSQFVSLASHQLRTPITTVKWYTGMLLNGDAGELLPKQRSYVETVRAGNETMIELVDTLLNVSRVEVGALQIVHAKTDVIEVCESVLAENLPKIEQKRLVIEKLFDEKYRYTQSDKRLLRIIMQNLISNAIKYTPDEGTVRITLEIVSGAYTLRVADTGCGIPSEEQDKIFHKMFRASNVQRMSVEGNGLGLYLVKSIVEKMNGSISFTSVPEKGTTFTVSFSR